MAAPIDPWKSPALTGVDPQMSKVLQALSTYCRDLVWSLPWGLVGETYRSDGTSAAIGTTASHLTTIANVPVEAGRKYHVSGTVNFYSPSGASNFVVDLRIGGVNVEMVEMIPSTGIGRVINVVNYPYAPTASGPVTFSLYGRFQGAAGIVLLDTNRKLQLSVVDVGPAS